MQARFGPGPVFVYEWLTTSRRWQLYASRPAFVCAILAGMIFISRTIPQPTTTRSPKVTLQALASYGRALYLAVISIELTIVLLVAPAATAGAVCLDKMRGTLDHMLATDLSNGEIVLGKLGVRLVPVLGMVACVLPIMAIAGLLGGIDPNALFGSFLVAIACAMLGCSLALLLSVWGRKTHEVLMITYLLMTLWLFSPFLLTNIIACTGLFSLRFDAPLLWRWLESTNPYHLAWAPYTAPGSVSLTSYLAFLGACTWYPRRFHCSGDLEDSRRRTETGRAIAGPRGPRVARGSFACSGTAKALPWPVARWQPGFLARMVPVESFEFYASGLGCLLGLRHGLDRDRAAKLGLRQNHC